MRQSRRKRSGMAGLLISRSFSVVIPRPSRVVSMTSINCRLIWPGNESEKKGGRKKASSAHPGIVEQLEEIAEVHTAGSAVQPNQVWVSQSAQFFSHRLAEHGFNICANTAARLLTEDLQLARRKMAKNLTLGESVDRNAQFERLNQLKQYYLSRGWPVLSIDTKKKELLGRFDRAGRAWTNTHARSWDHDFPSSSWGKIIPYGVYDLAHNEAFVYLAGGADTGELACAAIRRWWNRMGRWKFDHRTPVLLLADCGGSNGYRVPWFRYHLSDLAQRLERTFRVCHLPPYCSKYNPIDHRVFCHLTRSLEALQMTGIEVIFNAFNSTTTTTGLRVVCEKARKQYKANQKPPPSFYKNEPTIRDEKLSAYNYKFSAN